MKAVSFALGNHIWEYILDLRRKKDIT
ncbi:hypothetical protein HKBW3S43_01651, partial [Candidatus Hakubella thermalkaliphila]